MAAAKKLTRLAGDDLNLKTGNHPAQVPNAMALAIAVDQLQKSLDEVITRFNAHTHGGITAGAGTSGIPNSTLVTGATVASPNLFPAAAG